MILLPQKTKAQPAPVRRQPRPITRRSRWAIPAITPIGSDAPVSETLPRAVKRIAETLRPQRIILFGSYAYGNPTPDSDVDLLVVLEMDAPRKERFLVVSRLLRPRPFAVDILVKTPQELEFAMRQGDFFIREIVSRGKVLYERSQ